MARNTNDGVLDRSHLIAAYRTMCTIREFEEHVRREVAGAPVQMPFDEMPRTATWKIRRSVLERMLEAS